MTPADQDTLDRLKSTYPGCVGVETEEGLVVVRKPSAVELQQLEDAVSSMTDLSAKPNPYAGLEELKRLVVYPNQDKVEEILQSFVESFDQILGFVRSAACDGLWPSLIETDLRDEELYMKEGKPDGAGKYPKRAGGRLFVVEHFRYEERSAEEYAAWDAMTEAERIASPSDNPAAPRRVVVGRYLARRMGLVEHRILKKQIEDEGFLKRTQAGTLERVPSFAMFAEIARTHVLEAPGVSIPDWEKHPYLLMLLGQTVRKQSALKARSDEGKS